MCRRQRHHRTQIGFVPARVLCQVKSLAARTASRLDRDRRHHHRQDIPMRFSTELSRRTRTLLLHTPNSAVDVGFGTPARRTIAARAERRLPRKRCRRCLTRRKTSSLCGHGETLTRKTDIENSLRLTEAFAKQPPHFNCNCPIFPYFQ